MHAMILTILILSHNHQISMMSLASKKMTYAECESLGKKSVKRLRQKDNTKAYVYTCKAVDFEFGVHI